MSEGRWAAVPQDRLVEVVDAAVEFIELCGRDATVRERADTKADLTLAVMRLKAFRKALHENAKCPF